MPNSVWVVVETWKGRVADTSFEALALGRELADALGGPLQAVAPGHGHGALAEQLGLADEVLLIEHAALAEPEPSLWADAVSQLPREPAPEAVLVPLTNLTLGLGTLLAARWNAPAVNFCTGLAVSGERIVATCLLYGGKIEAVAAPVAAPAVFGLWPGARPAAAGRSERIPAVRRCVYAPSSTGRPVLLRYIEPEAGDVDITRQEALVAVGRGIQSQDNLEVAEELARVLGGAVCGSRPVVDQGWLPLSRQVGKSGQTVKPRLYVALGISGAPEHLEGMKDSQVIIAVNTDRGAPIFQAAHYGYVGDAVDFAQSFAQAVLSWKEAHV